MSSEDIKLIVVGLIVITCIGFFEHRKRNKLCERCGGRRKLITVKDPIGKNISKTSTVGIYLGVSHKKLYKLKCQNCGHITSEKWY